jgi:integrase
MGKLITEAALQKALREVAAGKKAEVKLSDPAPRGGGRLVARVRPGLVEWYARRTAADGRRTMQKLGAWPAMPVADARRAFGDAPAPAAAVAALPAATFGDLVDGYLARLAREGKGTKHPKGLLNHAAAVIGRERQAGDVTPADVVRVIKPIFDRGARVQADKMRVFLNAAFRWGMKAEHDYRVATPRRWGIASNPVEAVPRDAEADRAGDRWLEVKELVDLLHWAMASDAPSRRAIALLALTGQRVHEIIDLQAGQWDSGRRVLTWAKTKNGLPHTAPVCSQAAAILDAIEPGPAGWLFPSRTDAGKPMTDAGVLQALKKYAARWRLEAFTGRDLRRTWKTLAGEAGLTKQERDLLQNHTEGDVSSRHYDRWQYMPEKLAAVAKWEAWLCRKLRASERQPGQERGQEAHPLRDVVVRGGDAAEF